MSNLLKFARARDDQDFVWRIAAAMMVRAQETSGWELTDTSRRLVEWVFANPMITPAEMINRVSTNTAIAANVVVEAGGVETSSVPDSDIQFVVNEVWEKTAQSMALRNLL